jgi:hypothetical protein
MTSLRPLHVFAVVVVAILPAANTLSPKVEHDTWWHLRVGKYVEETGCVPQTDPFSRMSQEHPTPWRAYSWLYEWALYRAYAAGGLTAIMWVRTLLAAGSAAIVLAFWFRRAGFGPVGLILAAPVAVAVMPMATERPWHVTIAFTAITAWAVTAFREGTPVTRFFWLPLVFALWANVHIQFVLGWGVLGLACLFPGKASRWAVVALTAGCFVATFFNPYHVGLLHVIWEYASQGAPLKLVQELSAPQPFSPWTLATLAVFAWAGTILVYRRPIDWFDVLFLLSAGLIAARMYRDMWFIPVAAAAVLRPGDAPVARRWVVPVVVVATFLAARLYDTVVRHPDLEAAQAEKFPVRAVEEMKPDRIPGPIYNDFDWGGYLIWAAPEYPVSIDGRTNLFGNERMLRSFTTWSTEDGWKADPDFRTANVVLAQKHRVLTGVLFEQSDRWRVAYEDELGYVFVRKSPSD